MTTENPGIRTFQPGSDEDGFGGDAPKPAEPQPQTVPMPPEPEAQVQELSPQEEDFDGEVDVDEGAVTEDSENADEIPRPNGGHDYDEDGDPSAVPDFDAEERDEDQS